MHKTYNICIIGGCGHVGLPLAMMFAKRNKNVIVYDKNIQAIELIQNGIMPFEERGGEDLLKEVLRLGTLTFTSDPAVISDSENIIMVIGTPVDEHLNPELSVVKNSIDEISKYLTDGQLLILRSTVYPGTTKRIGGWIDETGKKVGVAFCPERIVEGNAIEELSKLPQIVSALDDNSEKRPSELFGLLTNDIITVEPMEAELTKLYSNAWRYIEFAVANQFYTIANDYGVDFYKIHHAMTHNYPRCANLPKPGFAAGPCLFKDTMQLNAFNNNNFTLGYSAMLVNEGLPNYIFKKLKEQFDLSKMSVGILGMAFKAESDDIRESLSYKIKKIAEFESKEVFCSDPYVKDDAFIPEDELINKSDIIIIAAPHKRYSELNIDKSKKIVDIWSILGTDGKF